MLRAEGDPDLSSRAYAAAFDADPTNAQALWDRAEIFDESGQANLARELYRRIANGEWDPKYAQLKQSAQSRLR